MRQNAFQEFLNELRNLVKVVISSWGMLCIDINSEHINKSVFFFYSIFYSRTWEKNYIRYYYNKLLLKEYNSVFLFFSYKINFQRHTPRWKKKCLWIFDSLKSTFTRGSTTLSKHERMRTMTKRNKMDMSVIRHWQ